MTATSLTLALGSLLLLCSCKKPAEVTTTEITPILQLQDQDTWVYQTTIEARKAGVELDQFPEDLAIQRSVNPDSLPVVSYEESHTYVGRQESPKGPLTDVFEVRMGDHLSQIEYNLVEGHTYSTLGYQQLYPQKGELIWFGTPILLIDSEHQGGEYWEMKINQENGQSVVLSEMRVIGYEEVTLPAGTFNCLHIQSVGVGFPHRVMRDIWFAPGVGLIVDRMQRFDEKSLVMTEERALIRSSKLNK